MQFCIEQAKQNSLSSLTQCNQPKSINSMYLLIKIRTCIICKIHYLLNMLICFYRFHSYINGKKKKIKKINMMKFLTFIRHDLNSRIIQINHKSYKKTHYSLAMLTSAMTPGSRLTLVICLTLSLGHFKSITLL